MDRHVIHEINSSGKGSTDEELGADDGRYESGTAKSLTQLLEDVIDMEDSDVEPVIGGGVAPSERQAVDVSECPDDSRGMMKTRQWPTYVSMKLT